jgi:UDP-2-acetamido-3-amino-2,3-dideoxy-glucuronate N-acetyltransferase
VIPGVTIGRWAMVGAGAVVVHSVPDYALVTGNPARLVGHVCACGSRLESDKGSALKCVQCERAYFWAAQDQLVPLRDVLTTQA